MQWNIENMQELMKSQNTKSETYQQ